MLVTILMHEKDPPLSHYILGAVADIWRAQGHQVEDLHGLSRPIRGDVVFLHVDLTRTPEQYQRAVADHPRVMNRGVVDISKTRYSRLQVRSPEEWDSPVIVKTVRNHGGYPERRVRSHSLLGRLPNLIGKARRLSLGWADHLHPHHYPVFESAREVPRGVFRNRALMVEKFLPERQGELNWTRMYGFLGDAAYSHMRGSRELTPCVGQSLLWREVPVHPGILAIRKELGFDFGAFDYVVHGGEAILLDANRTVGTPSDTEMRRWRAGLLAPGLASLPSA